MFHGIEMNVIDMTGIIQAVANRRFPLSSLPDAPFAFGDAHGGQLLGLRHRFRKRDLDRFPTGRVVYVARRQCPDTMLVIGQHDPAIDMKRTCRSNLSHRRAQCRDLVDEQATLTFQPERDCGGSRGWEDSTRADVSIRRKALCFSALRPFPFYAKVR